MIMEDIRPTDGWLYNVSTGTTPMGTPVEITQDRFRSVFPNTTKVWTVAVKYPNGNTTNFDFANDPGLKVGDTVKNSGNTVVRY